MWGYFCTICFGGDLNTLPLISFTLPGYVLKCSKTGARDELLSEPMSPLTEISNDSDEEPRPLQTVVLKAGSVHISPRREVSPKSLVSLPELSPPIRRPVWPPPHVRPPVAVPEHVEAPNAALSTPLLPDHVMEARQVVKRRKREAQP
ncbi:hypothetical protein C8J57DRAFT_1238797 [Mycena rebaudengoi]|nr:hypothetical protein C8J57DRAFT_1238797 [Mycena rebaudengoi]